jgi:primosomal protein N' (replication factor Y)
MTLFAEVVFPLPLDRTFHYLVPDDAADRAAPGVRIRAPLGPKIQAGFIIGVSGVPPAGDYSLKEIREVLDAEPALTAAALAFARRLSTHHRSPMGEFLQAMLPPSLEFRASMKIRLTGAGAAAAGGKALRGAERAIAESLGGKEFGLTTLKRRTGFGRIEAAVRRMAAKGLIEVQDEIRGPKRIRTAAPIAPLRPSQLELDFSAASGAAALLGPVSAAIAGGGSASFYLHGPEEARWSAYVRLIRETRERARPVLVLVPDVARAESLLGLISARLGLAAALIHGGVPHGRREREWRDVRSGRTGIAVGPRSVLFAPLDRPGLVIVDDEADDSYFQAESPAYDARAGARLNAEEAGAVLVLGAESPRVEEYAKAVSSGSLIELPVQGSARSATIVDDGAEKGLLARAVLDAVGRTLEGGGRGVVFINRRGYASFLFCPRCGRVPRCPDCGSPLVFSKREASLSCGSCRTRTEALSSCPECGSRVLEPRGAGVEAVEEDLRSHFPSARIGVVDRGRGDAAAAREKTLDDFASGKIDLLVGTQALAREAPARVQLAVILNPEALLGASDYRAAQRTYRTIRRMLDFAGPQGRGTAFIQTAFPGHHGLRAAARGDFRLFFDEEIRLRKAMDLPPFAVLAEILFWGGTPRTLAVRARDFVRRAGMFRPRIDLIGPALAAGPGAHGRRGVQVVLRARSTETLDACLEKCLRPIPGRRSVVRSD